MGEIAIKSIHERAAADDGHRILIERWWPRGVSWRRAALDDWIPDLAPSAGLRWRLAHDPDNWAAFEALYRAELECHGARIAELLKAQAGRRLTLLHAARDPAVVLADWLQHMQRKSALEQLPDQGWAR